MVSVVKMSRVLVAGVALLVLSTGCTKKPSQDELTKLEEARQAAESAERKYADLKQERMALEDQLAQKKGELSKVEEERDDVKAKMEARNQ